MPSNYFTLYHVAGALQSMLAKSVLAEAYSQEKNMLSLLFYTPEPVTVTISCAARNNFITARPGIHRAKKNSVNLFPSLTDKHIEHIYLCVSDRIVYFKFTEGLWLCAEMFSSKANIAVIDGGGKITDAFLRKKELLSSRRILQSGPQPIGISDVLPEKKELLLLHNEEGSVFSVLKNNFSNFGSVLNKEILFRLAVKESAGASTLDEQQWNAVHREAAAIASFLLGDSARTYYMYFDGTDPICFSLLPLTYLAGARCETYDDLFSCIQRFIGFSRSTESFHENKQRVVQWIKKELDRTHRTIGKISDEAADLSRAKQYELFGSLLMTHLHSVGKGKKEILLENSFAMNEPTAIPLDPSLSPVQNAERYFEKAKRSKAAVEDSRLRIAALERKASLFSTLQNEITPIAESISLKKFLHLHDAELKEYGFMTEKEQEDLPPFKIFTVEGGFTVYAGKSSENNDLLTVKFAKPNDLWFHARGSSGSHVVLRTGSSVGTPSKKAIEQAAAIAAYYSKMKNAKNVPVAMCEKKYVRKPKGVPAGTVVIEREKVIFVEPKLPG